MVLIVGLGNPGKKFKKTRHNLGLRVLENFFNKQKKSFHFSSFKMKRKFLAQISQGSYKGKKIYLAKPQTFMNESGQAVKKILNNLKIKELIVLHDDLDLPLGKIKISKNKGPGGHKGVESIIKELETKNFLRIRIGIQPKSGKSKNPKIFVLKNFNKNEEQTLKETFKKTRKAIEIILKENPEKAMTKYN